MSPVALPSPPPAVLRAAEEGPDPSRVTPGLLGFAVVALLALAVWFLMRSMVSRMRNVQFEEGESGPGEPASDQSGEPEPDRDDRTST